LASTAEEINSEAEELAQLMTFFKLAENSNQGMNPVRNIGHTKGMSSPRKPSAPAETGDFVRF